MFYYVFAVASTEINCAYNTCLPSNIMDILEGKQYKWNVDDLFLSLQILMT